MRNICASLVWHGLRTPLHLAAECIRVFDRVCTIATEAVDRACAERCPRFAAPVDPFDADPFAVGAAADPFAGASADPFGVEVQPGGLSCNGGATRTGGLYWWDSVRACMDVIPR